MEQAAWSGRPAAGWYDDPARRNEYRYFDGEQWTSHVANAGRTSSDPADGPYPPPTADMRPPGIPGQTGNGHTAHGVSGHPAPPRSMGFAEAVRTCLAKYVDFRGRAGRPEYWWFALFSFLVLFAASFIGMSFGGQGAADTLTSLVFFALFLPNLSVTVRRLHDSGRTGWFVLVGLVPILGAIALLVFMLLPSTPGPNRYGPA